LVRLSLSNAFEKFIFPVQFFRGTLHEATNEAMRNGKKEFIVFSNLLVRE